MKKIDYKAKIEQFEKKNSMLIGIKEKLPKKSFSLKIDSTENMFNQFDSSDINHRNLNSELNEYLLNQVDNIDFLPNLTVHIKIEKNENNLSNEDLKKIFKNHFEDMTIKQFISNQRINKKWLRFFLYGLIFLGICLLLSRIFLMPAFEDKPAFTVIRESLSIIGCVAIWEPTGHFFFGRKENKKVLRNYMILHQADYIFV